MARMPGGEPRSVSDPDGEGYDAMLRQYKAGNSHASPGSAAASTGKFDWRKHPGAVESFVPVWGSAREAAADWHEGDRVGAVINGALAVSDLIPGALIAKGASKAGVKAALKAGTSTTWKNTQRRMARAGFFEAGEQGHHWAIPQRWKWVPEEIRNHPANIKALPADVHKRLHSPNRINDLPKFGFVEGVVRGTPAWAKADAAQALAANGEKLTRPYGDTRRR